MVLVSPTFRKRALWHLLLFRRGGALTTLEWAAVTCGTSGAQQVIAQLSAPPAGTGASSARGDDSTAAWGLLRLESLGDEFTDGVSAPPATAR